MNKISTILIILVILLSCNDFLEITPKASLNESILSTKEGVESLLIGAYALLDGTGNNIGGFGSAASNWIYGSICGGDAHVGSDPESDGLVSELLPFEIFSSLPTTPFFNEKWRAVYEGVSRANTVLKVLKNVMDAPDDDTIQISSQAHVLRGIYHFEAKKMWNMVPYIDGHVDPNLVKNDKDIWPQIESDLKYGYDRLPEIMNEIGRINKWVACAFYAKALMFQNKHREAKLILEDIYTNGKNPLGEKFGLTTLFKDNFNNAETENNTESVFAFQYSVNDKSSGYNGSFGELLNYPMGGPAGCCGFFQPSTELVNSFRTGADGLPLLDGSYNEGENSVIDDEGLDSNDPFTPDMANLDPRLDWTVGRRGVSYLDWGNHPGKTWIRNQSFGGPYSPKKNIYAKSQAENYTDHEGWTSGSTAINFKAIRFADIILWLAECEVEVGSLDKARQYVNMIRARAANPEGFVTKDDVATPAANYVISIYPDSGYPFDTRDNARKAVHFERKLELAMEGHRFFDLVRWGEAASTINAYFNYEKLRRDYLKAAKFDERIDDYFPIPQHQIDLTGSSILFQNR